MGQSAEYASATSTLVTTFVLTPTGKRGVDLEHGRVHHVGERKTRAPLRLRRRRDAVAQRAQQFRDALFLARLSRVVRGPRLLVRPSHDLRFGHAAVGLLLADDP